MKSNRSRIAVLFGGIAFIITLVINILVLDNKGVQSFGQALIIGLLMMVLVQSIYNYLYIKIELERNSVFSLIFRIVLGLVILKLIF